MFGKKKKNQRKNKAELETGYNDRMETVWIIIKDDDGSKRFDMTVPEVNKLIKWLKEDIRGALKMD